MNDGRVSIGREKAIALGDSKFWESMSFRERAEFQMATVELCMPFGVFHEAVEKTVGRPVFTHEFGLDYAGLWNEVRGLRSAPTFEEVMGLIPAEKLVVINQPQHAAEHRNNRGTP